VIGGHSQMKLQAIFQQPSGIRCEAMGETAGTRGDSPVPLVPAKFFRRSTGQVTEQHGYPITER
jgi:hypothetical protein